MGWVRSRNKAVAPPIQNVSKAKLFAKLYSSQSESWCTCIASCRREQDAVSLARCERVDSMSCFSGRRFGVKGIAFFSLIFLAPGIMRTALSQGITAGAKSNKDSHDQLIPVKDPLVIEKCGTCHSADANGNLSRISSIRTTPEGWEEAIKRMIRLNGLQLSPDDARKILRYLSDSHGLAPEEAKPIQYFVEREQLDEKLPNGDVQHACASCHAFAKPLSWRRTPQDWDYLKNMHVAFFPSIDGSFRRGHSGAGGPPEAANADGSTPKQPVDIALAYVKKSTPLITPEWSSWEASQRSPKLGGSWLVSGSLPGKGKFFGEMKIEPSASGDGTYTTQTNLSFTSGMKWSSSGSSIVYTGYAWRGRSKSTESSTSVDAPNAVREVMMLSKDESEMTGRWFWGTYQEFGMTVSIQRALDSPAVLGVDVDALKAGTSDNTVQIFGAHLPSSVAASDVDLGPGVTVTKIVSETPTTITVTASVDAKATPGRRLVAVKSFAKPDAYAVYDHMNYLKVTPQTPIAHLGSEPHAKGYMQFEAIAFSNGPDGKPNTEDDIYLGVVPATWKLEEFVASYGDDDVDFVGALNQKSGLFIPASDGPDPKRKSMRNNYGDVWAVATYKPDGAPTPLVGRSYFVVGVPQYVQWDQPEVAQ
jgi:quinohemoprotein amine dehydrogenase